VQDAYVPTVYHVRYRVLKVELGRWLQRDPAGYVDGANLYEYAVSSPLGMVDRMGLASGSGSGAGCGIGGAVETFSDCGTGGSGSAVEPGPDPSPPGPSCGECLSDAKQESWYRSMLQSFRSLGCPLPSSLCTDCDGLLPPKLRAAYLPDNNIIIICSDRVASCKSVGDLLRHEMWHAWERCQGRERDDCCDCVCSELMAIRWDGSCRDGGSSRKPGETYEECLDRRSAASCISTGDCSHHEAYLCFVALKDTCHPHSIQPPDIIVR